MGRTAETAREGVLYGEDGRDCEGRECCMGRTAETAREGVLYGKTAETAREGGLCGRMAETTRGVRLYGVDGRDCEGRECCVGWAVQTARGRRVVCVGWPRLRGEGGLCGKEGRDCQGARLC